MDQYYLALTRSETIGTRVPGPLTAQFLHFLSDIQEVV